MSTFSIGRKIVRASDFVVGVTQNSSMNFYQVSLPAAPTGVIARIYSALFVEKTSGIAVPAIGESFSLYAGGTYVDHVPSGGPGMYKTPMNGVGSKYVFANNSPILTANSGCFERTVPLFDGISSFEYNGSVYQTRGPFGTLLLPDDRPLLISLVSPILTGTGNVTCGLWEVY